MHATCSKCRLRNKPVFLNVLWGPASPRAPSPTHPTPPLGPAYEPSGSGEWQRALGLPAPTGMWALEPSPRQPLFHLPQPQLPPWLSTVTPGPSLPPVGRMYLLGEPEAPSLLLAPLSVSPALPCPAHGSVCSELATYPVAAYDTRLPQAGLGPGHHFPPGLTPLSVGGQPVLRPPSHLSTPRFHGLVSTPPGLRGTCCSAASPHASLHAPCSCGLRALASPPTSSQAVRFLQCGAHGQCPLQPCQPFSPGVRPASPSQELAVHPLLGLPA